jgi:5-methylcytosine-specific restriction endonuclease McrA
MKQRCELCGITVESMLEAHHIHPKANGGSNEPGNLMTVCANCHRMLTSIMGKLNGHVPSPKEIRHLATSLNRFACVLKERELMRKR